MLSILYEDDLSIACYTKQVIKDVQCAHSIFLLEIPLLGRREHREQTYLRNIP